MTSKNIFQNPPTNPLLIFEEWYNMAQENEINDPGAVSLATVDASGQPHSRIVLIREVSTEKGFCFFTNTHSFKGQQIGENPKVALCFHWKSLRKQVRIEGTAHLTSDEAADQYFAGRHRQSQVGAWASKQSEVYENRAVFDQAFEEAEKRFEGQDVPRPPHWSGYQVTPHRIEFWSDGEFRLHDRILYTRKASENDWETELLYP